MALLSDAPAREICFSHLAAIMMLLVATNFDAVWSTFMSSSGMLCWRTLSVISWRNYDLTSAQRDLVITGLNVVTARRENYILWYNDRTYDLVTLKSIYLRNLSGFARIKPFSTPETTWMLIPAPANRRFTSIERNLRLSTSSIRNVRPPFFFCCWFFVTFYPWTQGAFG